MRRLRHGLLGLTVLVACTGEGKPEASSAPMSYVDLATVEPAPIVDIVPIPENCDHNKTVFSLEPIPCCPRDVFGDALHRLAIRCTLAGGNAVTSGLEGCWNECHIDDLEHGPTIVWFSDGRVKRESTYRHGVKVGLERKWDEKGQLRTLTNFNDDGSFGCHYNWDEDGALIYTSHCD